MQLSVQHIFEQLVRSVRHGQPRSGGAPAEAPDTAQGRRSHGLVFCILSYSVCLNICYGAAHCVNLSVQDKVKAQFTQWVEQAYQRVPFDTTSKTLDCGGYVGAVLGCEVDETWQFVPDDQWEASSSIV